MDQRRITQIVSAIALHSSWGPQAKWICQPVLSCHSCALAWFACPIGVFVHFAGWHAFPYLALGALGLVAVIGGRFVCGWVCPFGFFQDLLYKIPSRKFALPAWSAYFKYAVLLGLVFAAPWFLGADTRVAFCTVCPAAALEVALPAAIASGFQDVAFWSAVKLSVLGGVILLAIMSSRSFCKVFCPLGAFLAPFNLISFYALKRPVSQCVGCQLCDNACAVGGQPSTRVLRGDSPSRALECLYCQECVKSCAPGNKEKSRAARPDSPLRFPDDRNSP
ncbi:MAG: putative electron transport protein YccM [candidate division BRC1 bacterium ADurb.BinA364]|nr:MAG: putative electron transport protein YccM [candidate division BRC1 bacterium ADurb.BinA364]